MLVKATLTWGEEYFQNLSEWRYLTKNEIVGKYTQHFYCCKGSIAT